MKMKNYIIRGIIILATSFLVFNIIWLLHDVYGDPISNRKAEKQLIAYLEETYPDYEKTYELEKISFDYKKQSYTIRCVNKEQPLFYFDVTQTYNGKIYDTYQENIKDGSFAWNTYVTMEYQKIDETLRQECDTAFDYCFGSYQLYGIDEQTIDDFYHNRNMDSLCVLTINGNRHQDDMSASSIASSFKELKALFETSEVPIHSYSISFLNEEGSKGIDIYNVTGEVIERDDFECLIEEVMESNDCFIDTFGFYALNTEITIMEE